MLWRCLSIICIIALVTATSAPTLAAGAFDRYLGAQYTGFDTYRRSAELTTGVYLRVPFSGGLRRSVSETRFGLTLGARLPAYDRYSGRRALGGMPKLFDLSIGLRGRESLRLNGFSIAGMSALHADEDGEPGKKKIWPWVVGGVVVLGVLVGLTAIALNNVGNSIDGIFEER